MSESYRQFLAMSNTAIVYDIVVFLFQILYFLNYMMSFEKMSSYLSASACYFSQDCVQCVSQLEIRNNNGNIKKSNWLTPMPLPVPIIKLIPCAYILSSWLSHQWISLGSTLNNPGLIWRILYDSQ